MNVQLSTGCGGKAELAAGKENFRGREEKWCGGRRRDVVATWTGCFQPQHGDFGAQNPASEKDCDTQGNIDLNSRVVHWFSRVNGGIVWLGEGWKIALLL